MSMELNMSTVGLVTKQSTELEEKETKLNLTQNINENQQCISPGVSELNLTETNNFRIKYSGLKCQKISLISICILLLVVIWVSCIVPAVYVVFIGDALTEKDPLVATNLSYTNLTSAHSRLPFLIQFGSINFTIQCPKGFEFSEYTGCEFTNSFCDVWYPAGNFGLYTLRIGLPIMAIIGLILSVLSNTTLIFKLIFQRDHKKKNSFIYELFESMLTPSLFNLYIFSTVYILLHLLTDVLNPSQTYCEPSGTWDRILGPLFSIFFYGFCISVNLILLNLLLTITFPFSLHSNIRNKVVLYCVQTIIAIGIPIVLCGFSFIFGEEGIEKYYTSEDLTRLYIPEINFLYFGFLPFLLLIHSIITITLLIFVKLRWNYLKTQELNLVPRKLLNLEFRILIYSLVVIANIIFLVCFGIIATKLLLKKEYAKIPDRANCATVRSPVIIYTNNTEIGYSSAAEAYRDIYDTSRIPAEYEQACHKVDLTNKLFPPIFYVFLGFLVRLLVMSIFIVTLPTRSNLEVWKKILKKARRINSIFIEKSSTA